MDFKKSFKCAASILLASAMIFNLTCCKKTGSSKNEEPDDFMLQNEEYDSNSVVSSEAKNNKKTKKAQKTDKATTTTTKRRNPFITVAKSSDSSGCYNPLSGLNNISSGAVGKRPYAVVVENSPAARPQWGISTPDILVEGMAEGGITRMLLLYSDPTKIPKIGPLRSARHDFVEISQCFDSIFVHCGWSIYAEKKIKSEGVNNLNGIMSYNPQFFRRDSSRMSLGLEHTAYTNGSYIRATVSTLGYRMTVKEDYAQPFKFHPADSPATPSQGSCSSLSFSFSGGNNHVIKYRNGIYYDFLNGSQRLDSDDRPVNYENLLILFCNVKRMGDDAGCVDMSLETVNRGYYVSNGGYEEVNWTRRGSGADSKLIIGDADDKIITLNAGRTYIAIVPSSQKGTLKFS